jgi:acyl-CoA thioesterase-2
MTASTRQLDRLLRQLELDQLDRDLFLGDPGKGEGRLFGGLVAAQSVVAAYRTVDQGSLHSLHAYFLRPGRHNVPIRYVVYRIRDGRTFTSRDVVAYQSGEAIFSLSSSFTRPEEGRSYQDPMPGVPGPEGLPEWQMVRPDRTAEEREATWRWQRENPIEVRSCDSYPPGSAWTRSRRVWMRVRGELPDDEMTHAAVVTFASDHGLLATARPPELGQHRQETTASLDHAIWFHYPPRFDGWLLYSSHTPVANAARALIFGQMHSEEGRHIVSVVQEGLVREPRPTTDGGRPSSR